MHGLTPGATTASVNLNWFSTSANCSSSSTDDGKTLVRLFNASGSLIETFEGKTAKGPTGKCAHKATITGLTPSTLYKYSVSNNGKDWSYDYNYKTPPSGNVFTFALVADPQVTEGNQDNNTSPKATPATTAQGWKDIVSKIAARGATFIACAGDQVDGGITYIPGEYTIFFAPEPLRSIPLAPVLGNHDVNIQYFNHFNMPNLSNSSGVYDGKSGNYYYLYNNILFVALNTGFSSQNGISFSSAQSAVAEFDKTFKAAKAAHPVYDWLIVQHHKSTTSISAHSADQDQGFLIEAGLEKLITDNGVDVVLAGHDHIHTRSHLMKWDDSKKYSTRSTDKGTIYLTLTTSSGVKYYPPFFILEDGAQNAGPYSEKYPVLVDGTRGVTEFRKATNNSFTGTVNKDKIPLSLDFYVPASNRVFFPNYTPNYTIFEVNGKTIKATTYTSEDKVVDEFTLTPKGR
jgi:3',5'-cyclic AMP phosphodiesterase CpdA